MSLEENRKIVVGTNPIFGTDAHLNKEQQDPLFYEGSGQWVLEISYGEYCVRIYSDGDTRAVFKPVDGEDMELYGSEDFIEVGLNTDSKISKANEDDMLEWYDNPWFDMYDSEGQHLDCVSHSLDEAIGFAEGYLKEQALSSDIIMGVVDLTKSK